MDQLERNFLKQLPSKFKDLDADYWSSYHEIEQSCTWLKSCKNILDLGSGVGKFCIIGTQLLGSNFFGVDHNLKVHQQSQIILKNLKGHRVKFIHGDLFDISLIKYDGFYIYNPFVENISIGKKIDQSINYNEVHYNKLHDRLMQKLNEINIGSLVVNNSFTTDYFNEDFELLDGHSETSLTLWKKKY